MTLFTSPRTSTARPRTHRSLLHCLPDQTGFVPLAGEDVFFTFARQVAPPSSAVKERIGAIQRTSASAMDTAQSGSYDAPRCPLWRYTEVFDDVEVKGTHLNGAEAHQSCTTSWKSYASYALRMSSCALSHNLRPSDPVPPSLPVSPYFCRIKTVQVCQQEARGVTDRR